MKPYSFFMLWILGFVGLFVFDLFIEGVVLNGLNGTEQQKTIGFLWFGGD